MLLPAQVSALCSSRACLPDDFDRDLVGGNVPSGRITEKWLWWTGSKESLLNFLKINILEF
jgi:hypothetical protein